MPKPEFRWVPIHELYTPSKGSFFRLFKNYHWIYNDDTNSVLFYGKYPQTNSNKNVTERLVAQFTEQRIIKNENVDVFMVSQAWVEIDLKDYV